MGMKKSVVQLVITSVLVLAGANVIQAQKIEFAENTKIYTIFLTKGCSCEGGPDDVAPDLMTQEEIIYKLQNDCPGVDFIVRDLYHGDTELETVFNELYGKRQMSITDEWEIHPLEGVDGVLIIGWHWGRSPHYKLAFTGLPTIVAYNFLEWYSVPHKLFHTGKEEDSVLVGGPEYWNTEEKGKPRILTVQLDRRRTSPPAETEEMFQDLVDKVKLIQAIKKMRNIRILHVSPYKVFASLDYRGDGNKHKPDNYNEIVARELQEIFGIEIVRATPDEFYDAVEKADQKEAEKIAQMWIDEAEKMVDTTFSEVVKTAKGYLAFEALRIKYNCNAIETHMRQLAKERTMDTIFWPTLSIMEFQKRGIMMTCQGYENIMLTHLLGYFMTGRCSFMGDYFIDVYHDVDIVMHCGGAINIYGDDRRIPYVLSSHAESQMKNTLKPGSGTGMILRYPVDEPVTIWKMHLLQKKIGLHTGTTMDGNAIYSNCDWETTMCRTKVVSKVDVKKVQRYFSPDEYGNHRVVIFGDYRQRIKDLATFIGFEVFEEDR